MGRTAEEKFNALPNGVQEALREEGHVDEEGQLRDVPDREAMDWHRPMTADEVFCVWYDYWNPVVCAAKGKAVLEMYAQIKEALNG